MGVLVASTDCTADPCGGCSTGSLRTDFAGVSGEFEITNPSELNRWLPLIKWLLAIPHQIALFLIAIGAVFVAVLGFFAVPFTGRWPRATFEYLVGTARWYYRVLAHLHLMTDACPPFSMADGQHYPLRLTIAYPEQIANWRPLVQWLLAIPTGSSPACCTG